VGAADTAAAAAAAQHAAVLRAAGSSLAASSSSSRQPVIQKLSYSDVLEQVRHTGLTALMEQQKLGVHCSCWQAKSSSSHLVFSGSTRRNRYGIQVQWLQRELCGLPSSTMCCVAFTSCPQAVAELFALYSSSPGLPLAFHRTCCAGHAWGAAASPST
jgi:hypothetical protein